MDAKSAAETVRETMMKEADELRAKYEGELQGAEKAKAELEAWRKDREEWEKTTKENFLAMEKELKETKSKLEATEEEAVKAADESDVEAMKKIEAIRATSSRLRLRLRLIGSRRWRLRCARRSRRARMPKRSSATCVKTWTC